MKSAPRPKRRLSEAFIILHETDAGHGRYSIDLGPAQAELTYRVLAPDLISADHTFVPPAMRGTGAAAALVERLVADARADGRRIRPRCSYVEAMRRRHPEWADVFAS